MNISVSTLAERPELTRDFLDMENTWPEFIRNDPFGNLYYSPAVLARFADFVLIAQDADSGEILAKAHSIPAAFGDNPLPETGWDGAIESGLRAHLTGAATDTLVALEVFVRPAHQGLGLSGRMLQALRSLAHRHGFADVVVPVRPTGKDDPDEPMTDYAARTRADGLPQDPWLRTHVRGGGVIESVAHTAMVIAGTLDQWRDWTGLPFDAPGRVSVPGALAPVSCDPAHDVATYVEPNVWVRHRARA